MYLSAIPRFCRAATREKAVLRRAAFHTELWAQLLHLVGREPALRSRNGYPCSQAFQIEASVEQAWINLEGAVKILFGRLTLSQQFQRHPAIIHGVRVSRIQRKRFAECRQSLRGTAQFEKDPALFG